MISGLPRWLLDFPGGASGKEPTCQCRRCKRFRFNPWVRKILWRRKWQPTPVFLPGESHGQRSLVGYSPWGCKRIGHDLATEHVHMHSPKRYLYLLSYFIHPGAPKCVFSNQDFGLSSPDFAFEMKHSLTSQWHKH